jgi:hypothetical protein
MKKVRILFLLVPFVFYSCGILQNSRQAVSSSMSAASLISTSSRLLKRGGKAVASSTNTIKGLSISETEIIELSRKYMQKLDSASTIASEDNKYAIRLDSIMRKFDGIDEFNINYKVYINDEVNAFANSVLPTPVVPTKINEPIGLDGSCNPVLFLRIASDIAVTASS